MSLMISLFRFIFIIFNYYFYIFIQNDYTGYISNTVTKSVTVVLHLFICVQLMLSIDTQRGSVQEHQLEVQPE